MLINKHTGSLSWAACDVLCLGAMKINSSLTYEGCVDYAAANFQVCMFDANVESVLMNNGMILCFDACACLLYHFVRVFWCMCVSSRVCVSTLSLRSCYAMSVSSLTYEGVR